MTKSILAISLMLTLASCGKAVPTTGGELPFGTTDFAVTAPNAPTSYTMNGKENPSITLQRGHAFNFNVNAPGHPFFIMNTQGMNTANAYSNGVINQGVEVGTLTFTVPTNAPDILYYNCSNVASMSGQITITN